MTPIEHENVHKYLKAPSLAEIDAFIKELGISDLQFERYYEMPFRTINKIRTGQNDLARKYWHFIYEKIVPDYGLGYKKMQGKSELKNERVKPKRHNKFDINRLKSLK